MKNYLLKKAILALMASALLLQGAKAQITNPAAGPANGDLIFGAETVNSGAFAGTDLEVDLGSITQFSQTVKLTFANVSATDLGSVLNAGAKTGSSAATSYATATNDFWSVVGTTATSTTVPGYFKYAIFATLASDPGAQSQVTNSAFEPGIAGVYTGLSTSTGFTAAPNSNGAGGELLATNTNSYSSEENSPSAFFGFTSTGSTSFGGGGSLTLYALNPFSNSGNNPAKTTTGTDVALGSFSYTSSGGLVFTGTNYSSVAVPEPSSYVLIFTGLVALFYFNRRRALKS